MDKNILKTSFGKWISSINTKKLLKHVEKSKQDYYTLHLRLVFMDKDTVYPEKAVITTAKEHARNQLEVLVDDKDAMYVFDRGYVDYERFDRMTDEGYFFVSRLKKNAVIREVESFSVPEDFPVSSDRMVNIGSTENRTENVFRLLEVEDTERNKISRILYHRKIAA